MSNHPGLLKAAIFSTEKSHLLGHPSGLGKPGGVVGHPIMSVSLILLCRPHSRREYLQQFIHEYLQLPFLAIIQMLIASSSGPGGVSRVMPFWHIYELGEERMFPIASLQSRLIFRVTRSPAPRDIYMTV